MALKAILLRQRPEKLAPLGGNWPDEFGLNFVALRKHKRIDNINFFTLFICASIKSIYVKLAMLNFMGAETKLAIYASLFIIIYFYGSMGLTLIETIQSVSFTRRSVTIL